jgi:SanA protein
MKKCVQISIVVSLLGLVAVIGAGFLIRQAAKGRMYSDISSIPFRRVGLVLGCSRTLSDGRPNVFYDYRINAAAQLFKEHKVEYFIVSGDNHVVGYDESTDMKESLVKAGVPANRIYCDYAGFRTLDSVVRAKEVFGQTNITVISQEFHNQRAIYIAQHRGMDAIGFNAQDADARTGFKTKVRDQLAQVMTVLDVCLLERHPKFLGPRIEVEKQ